MCTELRVVCFVLLTLSTKVYAAQAKSLTSKSQAQTVAAADSENEKSKVSNYFVHEPYGPNTYAFGYEIQDPRSGNVQFRDERRYLNGSMEGSYGYVRPDGLISVTHFLANNRTGYLSQTQTYAPGDEASHAQNWPTSRAPILTARPQPANKGNVSFNVDSHLNVSTAQVADAVANMLKEEHGVDLNQLDVTHNVLQPAVLDIINGKVPLKSQPNGSLAFETVHNFIPTDFPLKPFELPESEVANRTSTTAATTTTSTTTPTTTVKPTQATLQQTTSKRPNSKYEQAKLNNAEKSPQTIDLRNEAQSVQEQQRVRPTDAAATVSVAATSGRTSDSSSQLPLPKPLGADNEASDNDAAGSAAWYNKIIDQSRREFLQNLPSLS